MAIPGVLIIPFAAGANVAMTGATLDLTLDPSVNVYNLVGTHSFQLLNWTGATQTGTFAITSDIGHLLECVEPLHHGLRRTDDSFRRRQPRR